MRGKWSFWESEKQIYLWIIWWGEEATSPIRKLSLHPLGAASAFMQNSEEMLFLPLFGLISHSLCSPNVLCVLLARSYAPAAWSNRWSASERRSTHKICFDPEIIKPLDSFFFSWSSVKVYRKSTPCNIASYWEKKDSRNCKFKRYEGHVKIM